ncbi:MAG: hypothetical protein ACOYLS_07500 [Polymorphobacter sp.]
MSEAIQGENSVHDFIVGAVQSAWDDSQGGPHKAMLLSALGTKLKNEFGDYSADFPKGIKEFLRTWPLVQMVQHPDIKEKIGLIPAGEPLPKDLSSLFPKAGERHSSSMPISYDQDFWNAFFKPIQSTRYVVIGDNQPLQILNDAAEAPPGAYEITKSDILTPDQTMPIAEKVVATGERINKWLEKNSLDASQFFRKQVSRTIFPQDRLTSLKYAFENISDEDRSRVYIPLDIILKIIS